MIDILLKFPSIDVAGQIGAALGYSKPDGQGGWNTTKATETLAIYVIGEHKRDGNWWVMVRSLVDIPIPAEIQQFIVTPDPNNPAIPNATWA